MGSYIVHNMYIVYVNQYDLNIEIPRNIYI